MNADKCPSCGSLTVRNITLPDGPHYGKVICAVCARFLRWLPFPSVPLEKLIVPPAPPAGTPLPDLIGTTGQVSWAGELRRTMMLKAAASLPSNIAEAALTITDATWWIANKDRDPVDYRWPRTWLPAT